MTLVATPRSTCGERDRRQSDRGFTHIALEVSDVDEAYRRVTALGLRTTCRPKVLRGGATKVIYLLGPEDNVVELIELPGQKHRATPAGKEA